MNSTITNLADRLYSSHSFMDGAIWSFNGAALLLMSLLTWITSHWSARAIFSANFTFSCDLSRKYVATIFCGVSFNSRLCTYFFPSSNNVGSKTDTASTFRFVLHNSIPETSRTDTALKCLIKRHAFQSALYWNSRCRFQMMLHMKVWSALWHLQQNREKIENIGDIARSPCLVAANNNCVVLFPIMSPELNIRIKVQKSFGEVFAYEGLKLNHVVWFVCSWIKERSGYVLPNNALQ